MTKKIFFALILLLCISLHLHAQSRDVDVPAPPVEQSPEEETFVIVEQMPEFPGGQTALMNYISANIKYPEECRKMGVEGKVFVKFIVDKTGSIINVQILRGIADGKLLEKEALRVVKAMPKWTPGKQAGKPVSVYFTMPIAFKLNAAEEEKK